MTTWQCPGCMATFYDEAAARWCQRQHPGGQQVAQSRRYDVPDEQPPQFIPVACPVFDKKAVPRSQREAVNVGLCERCGNFVQAPGGFQPANGPGVVRLGLLCFDCLGIAEPETAEETKSLRAEIHDLVRSLRDPNWVPSEQDERAELDRVRAERPGRS